ncbi:hypothetical protein PHOSAC3_140034 [Mesotoga infera]|nr:hypothetical protein PHOSAC3_140034 [Mesotoga infera]
MKYLSSLSCHRDDVCSLVLRGLCSRYKLLLRREFCVRALSRRLCISESAVSQHLKVLRSAHLVKGHKKGYFTHYSVDRGKLKELSNRLAELCEESSDTLLSKNIAIVQEPIGGGLNSSGECG